MPCWALPLPLLLLLVPLLLLLLRVHYVLPLLCESPRDRHPVFFCDVHATSSQQRYDDTPPPSAIVCSIKNTVAVVPLYRAVRVVQVTH